MTVHAAVGFGFCGGVVRGRCPFRICHHWLTRLRTCGTCPARPIKDVDITFGGLAAGDAISKGLVTATDVERFRLQITGVRN